MSKKRNKYEKPEGCPSELWYAWVKDKSHALYPCCLADGSWVSRRELVRRVNLRSPGVSKVGNRWRARCKVKGTWYNKLVGSEEEALALVSKWRSLF